MKNLFKTFNTVSTIFTIVEVTKASKKYLENNPQVVKKMADAYDTIKSKTIKVSNNVKQKFSNKEAKPDVTDMSFDAPDKI